MIFIAHVLSALAIAAAACAVVNRLVWLPRFALRDIVVEGNIKHLTKEQIQTVARDRLGGTFFTVDLERARAGFQAIPWVRSVALTRQWPDRLIVTVEEQVPLAHWGSLGLVNTFGEVFSGEADAALPEFIGPAGSSEEIARRYASFAQRLQTIGLVPMQVQLTARWAWNVKLINGMTLKLGREQVDSRLDRFVRIYGQTFARLERNFDYVDLRYPNGFALRVPQLATDGSGQAHREKTRVTGNQG